MFPAMGRFIGTRWQLTLVRLGILAFKIAIVVILILAVITPVTGGVKVDMPELNKGVWSFENGTLRLGTTVNVYNGAMFDVNDFYIDFGMTDANTTTLANFTTEHVNIRSGQWNNLDLRMTIDLNKMNRSTLSSFVFNVTKVNQVLDVGATYPLGWVSVNVGGNATSDWGPLIKDYYVDVNNMTVVPSGGHYSIRLPYHLSASDKVSGASITLTVNLRNASGAISQAVLPIVLSPDTNGYLEMSLSDSEAQYLRTHSDTLFFDVQAGFLSASVNKTIQYQWSP